jgi:acyl carrier protein
MTDQELLDSFTRILSDLLGNTAIVLGMETTRGDVPDWDSFNYVNFIVAVEVELGVKFRIADVESFERVGDIVKNTQALLRKTG